MALVVLFASCFGALEGDTIRLGYDSLEGDKEQSERSVLSVDGGDYGRDAILNFVEDCGRRIICSKLSGNVGIHRWRVLACGLFN